MAIYSYFNCTEIPLCYPKAFNKVYFHIMSSSYLYLGESEEGLLSIHRQSGMGRVVVAAK